MTLRGLCAHGNDWALESLSCCERGRGLAWLQLWNRFPRDVMESESLKVFKKQTWHFTAWLNGHGVFGGRLDLMILKGFSNLNDSVCLQCLGTGLVWGLPLTQAAHPGSMCSALRVISSALQGPKHLKLKAKQRQRYRHCNPNPGPGQDLPVGCECQTGNIRKYEEIAIKVVLFLSAGSQHIEQ